MMTHLSPYLAVNSQSSDVFTNASSSQTNSNANETPFSYFYYPMAQNNDATPIDLNVKYLRFDLFDRFNNFSYLLFHRHNRTTTAAAMLGPPITCHRLWRLHHCRNRPQQFRWHCARNNSINCASNWMSSIWDLCHGISRWINGNRLHPSTRMRSRTKTARARITCAICASSWDTSFNIVRRYNSPVFQYSAIALPLMLADRAQHAREETDCCVVQIVWVPRIFWTLS